jgi:hypothetical protein
MKSYKDGEVWVRTGMNVNLTWGEAVRMERGSERTAFLPETADIGNSNTIKLAT